MQHKPRIKVHSGSVPDYYQSDKRYDNRNTVSFFEFGEPESCLNNPIADYLGVFSNGDGIYEPPVSQEGLAKLTGVNAQHGPLLHFKTNMIMKWWNADSTDVLSRSDFNKFAFDYLTFGHSYFQLIPNRLGGLLRLRHLPALQMRYTTDKIYAMARHYNEPTSEPIYFKPGEVIQLKKYDPRQSIYGLPEYFGGIQSALLAQDSTLFRRRYYINGAHMGYVFSMADPSLSADAEDEIKQKILQSKGAGNFRSMFINNRSGQFDSAEKAIKVIPIGEAATKDEFERIRNITSDDMLSMHRVNEALAGQKTSDKAGTGDLDKITKNYYNNELVPLQLTMMQINDQIARQHHLKFHKAEYSDLA